MLVGPFEPFGPGGMTLKLLIPGFTAAVIGGMGSLPGAVLGGMIVGVGQSLGASGGLLPESVPGGGAVITFVWTKLHKESAECYVIPTASGAIAGESVTSAGYALWGTFRGLLGLG